MTLKLYGSARSRTSMPRWYLEEKWETFGVINPFAGMPALGSPRPRIHWHGS